MAAGDSPTLVLEVVEIVLSSLLRRTVDRKLGPHLEQNGFLCESHLA